jgi:predicted O-methyltransferase YrrM
MLTRVTYVGELVDRFRALPLRSPRATSLLLSQLRDLGWQASAARHESVGSRGEPIPWWTYSASHWLDLALAARQDVSVFEYGSGASTAWLAQRATQVVSVEHDAAWHEKVAPTLGGVAELKLVQTQASDADAELEDPYVAALSGGPYDLIVIDGMGRNACARAATEHVKDDGIVLFDDADRSAYSAGRQHLADAGLGRIDFFGPKPGAGHMSTTSLFSRDFNPWTRNLTAPIVSGY